MKDTLREECDDSEVTTVKLGKVLTKDYIIQECLQNCCITTFVASLFFVVFVLVAQVISPTILEKNLLLIHIPPSLSLSMWLWQF